VVCSEFKEFKIIYMRITTNRISDVK